MHDQSPRFGRAVTGASDAAPRRAKRSSAAGPGAFHAPNLIEAVPAGTSARGSPGSSRCQKTSFGLTSLRMWPTCFSRISALIGFTITPARSAPQKITSASIVFSESAEMRSPRATPSAARKLAKRRVSASNSSKVMREPWSGLSMKILFARRRVCSSSSVLTSVYAVEPGFTGSDTAPATAEASSFNSLRSRRRGRLHASARTLVVRGGWAGPAPSDLQFRSRSLVDLDVAPDQSTRPVRVSRRRDGEGVCHPGLAAIVDINGEGLRGRAGRPDHLGHPSELGALASRCRRAGRAGTADEQPADGFGLYPYARLMVVVLQVPCWVAALHHEAERGLRPWIGQTGNQSRHGHEVPERSEDGVALDLVPAGHLPGSRGCTAEAGARRSLDEPGREVGGPNHFLTGSTWVVHVDRPSGGNPTSCTRQVPRWRQAGRETEALPSERERLRKPGPRSRGDLRQVHTADVAVISTTISRGVLPLMLDEHLIASAVVEEESRHRARTHP